MQCTGSVVVGVITGTAPTAFNPSCATTSGLRTVCAPVSTIATAVMGTATVPNSPTASTNARDGPMRIGNVGPDDTRSANEKVKDGNYTPTLNEVKFSGTSTATICFTRNGSLPN